MFWPDVIDLQRFYHTTVGGIACRLLRRRLKQLWPQVKSERVLGLGFAPPLLLPYLQDAERLLCLMPAAQGVIAWPRNGENRATLVDEGGLPIPDNSVERVLVLHALEHTMQPQRMMEEIWRVLAPCGKLVVVVPNRLGLWSRLEQTPFGHGRPYSVGQLERLTKEAQFTVTDIQCALYAPPMPSFMRFADIFEQMGRFLGFRFGGVLILEAEKILYAIRPKPVAKRVPASLIPTMQPTAS